MSNTMKKTAIVCAVILVIGLAVGGIGYALGGARGLNKIAEKHDWIIGPTDKRTVTGQQVDTFHSVEVTGDADVYLVTEDYYKNQAWLADEELLSTDGINNADVYHVFVIKAEKLPEPVISVNNDTLQITTKEKHGVSFNFSDLSWTPKILICCPKEEMSSIRVSVDTGDVMMGGITYDDATIGTDTGDIETEHVIGEAQTIETDTGSVDLAGVFRKNTKVTSDTGDIDLTGTFIGSVEASSDTGDISFDTADFLKSYGDIDLKSDTGDISIEENGMDVADIDSTPAHYARSGEGTKLTMKTDTGDLELYFGDLEGDAVDANDESDDDD